MKQNKFPPGWDEKRVQSVIDYYENQTEDEAVAEDEDAFRCEFITTIEVPIQLGPDALDYSGFEERVSSMKNRSYYKTGSLEVSFMFPRN